MPRQCSLLSAQGTDLEFKQRSALPIEIFTVPTLSQPTVKPGVPCEALLRRCRWVSREQRSPTSFAHCRTLAFLPLLIRSMAVRELCLLQYLWFIIKTVNTANRCEQCRLSTSVAHKNIFKYVTLGLQNIFKGIIFGPQNLFQNFILNL